MYDEIDFPHFERTSFGLSVSASMPLQDMDGFKLAHPGVTPPPDVDKLNAQFNLPEAEVYTPEEIASYADYVSDQQTGQLLHPLSQHAMQHLLTKD